jgi:hypothetical protein
LSSQGQELLALLLARDHQARQGAVDQGAPERLVAAADLAGDHRRPQHSLGLIVGRRHRRIAQENQPFVAMVGEVLAQSAHLGTERFETGVAVHEPGFKTIVDFRDAPRVAVGRQLFATLGQIDGFLQERAEFEQGFLLRTRGGVTHFVEASEQMAVALPFGVLQNVVGLEAVDDQVAVEVGTEDFLGNLVAASARTASDGVDGQVLVGENPQPGIDGVDAPAGLVGMDDVAAAQGVEEQVIGGPGQVGEALLGPDQGGGTHLEITVGLQEIGDLAIRNAEAMLEFGGHGQDDGPQGVAGGADGVGGLLGMSPLDASATARTPTGLDVETRDDGDDGRQVGLVLNDLARFGSRVSPINCLLLSSRHTKGRLSS